MSAPQNSFIEQILSNDIKSDWDFRHTSIQQTKSERSTELPNLVRVRKEQSTLHYKTVFPKTVTGISTLGYRGCDMVKQQRSES